MRNIKNKIVKKFIKLISKILLNYYDVDALILDNHSDNNIEVVHVYYNELYTSEPLYHIIDNL